MRNVIEYLKEVRATFPKIDWVIQRELNWLISDYLGDIPAHEITEFGSYNWHRKSNQFYLTKATNSDGSNWDSWEPPHYTNSLNAAITLYPVCPSRIPSNALSVCIEALEAREKDKENNR